MKNDLHETVRQCVGWRSVDGKKVELPASSGLQLIAAATYQNQSVHIALRQDTLDEYAKQHKAAEAAGLLDEHWQPRGPIKAVARQLKQLHETGAIELRLSSRVVQTADGDSHMEIEYQEMEVGAPEKVAFCAATGLCSRNRLLLEAVPKPVKKRKK